MITIFSIPKPHVGHVGIIQSNAIRSWAKLRGCNVVLFGQEAGLPEFAASIGIRHEPDIARNDFGTPLVSDAFAQVRALSDTPLIAYVNADIVLTRDFLQAAGEVHASTFSDFLIVGQRRDIDITEPIDFTGHWEDRLRADVERRGVLHGKSGIDYFIFPRDFPVELPPFAVGRPGWDNWLIYRTRKLRIPVVDATQKILAVHQNHAPSYTPQSVEARQNTRSAGGLHTMCTLRDADWRLTDRGIVRFPFVQRIAGALLFSQPIRVLLTLKRAIYEAIPRSG